MHRSQHFVINLDNDITVYEGDGLDNFQIVMRLGDVPVYMSFTRAIALASALRVACGVEEPKAEEAA